MDTLKTAVQHIQDLLAVIATGDPSANHNSTIARARNFIEEGHFFDVAIPTVEETTDSSSGLQEKLP